MGLNLQSTGNTMWYIVLVAVLYAIGYITLPGLRICFQSWLFKPTFKNGDETEKPEPGAIEVPDQIVAYAKSWNTPWATDDCLERAKRLYLEHDRNWEVAYQELLKQDGEDK
jgi:hypothetical protein